MNSIKWAYRMPETPIVVQVFLLYSGPITCAGVRKTTKFKNDLIK